MHSCRITVRRENVLEDSFRQIRSRSALELRGKLVVKFHGEEGVDAGGLTREWYTCVVVGFWSLTMAVLGLASRSHPVLSCVVFPGF